MPRGQTFQSNFTSGVLDPRLKSRIDLAHYHNGVEIGDNVVVGPHGGMRRRPGTRFMHQLPASTGNVKAIPFSYNSTDQQYLIVLVDNRMYLYFDGELLTNLNGSGFDYLTTLWTGLKIRDIKWAQSADTMLLVHEDVAPQTLVRGATHTDWTLSATTFDFLPQVDYNDALSPTPTSEEQDVTFTGFSVGNTFKLDLEGVLTENITYDTVTATLANRIARAVGNLYNTGSGEVTCVFQAGTTYRVQFNFGAARNYDRMTGFATSGSGTIGVGAVADGVTRSENAWSVTRGYPRTVTFFENRLIFGGIKSKPQTIFASATNDFYNFDLGDARDDEAIQRTLDTDQVNTIQAVFSGRHLQVFTEGGDFYCPDVPMTPEKSSFRMQTSHGCPLSAGPVQADGATIFLDRYGRGLYQFIYDDIETSYTSTSLSRLASHLLLSPLDMDVQMPSSDEDTNYVYLVNTDTFPDEEGSSIIVLNTLRAEEIAAWTRWNTNGGFLSIAVLAERVYVVTTRIDGLGANQFFVEELDFSYYTDNAFKDDDTAKTVWTVPAHLNGVTCRVLGDGAPMQDQVPVAGQITLEFPVSTIEIGRNFNTRIRTMPPQFRMPGTEMQLGRARYKRVRCNVRQTQGLKINGYPMPERYLDADPLDSAPGALTGMFEIPLSGWGELIGLELTQDDPLPLQLLAVESEVEMH